MKVLMWIMDNWLNIIIGVSFLVIVTYSIVSYIKLPTAEKIKNLKEWLLYAVTVAESELGDKTGQLKLRKVYGMFIDKFPNMANMISFETFSEYVDEALEGMRKMIETNDSVAAMVECQKVR